MHNWGVNEAWYKNVLYAPHSQPQFAPPANPT